MALRPFLQSVISWLRAGYPEGVPERDYLPLFALLSQRLNGDDVHALAEELAQEAPDPASAQAIRRATAEALGSDPSPELLRLVSARLAAGGWPLARPSDGGAEAASAGGE